MWTAIQFLLDLGSAEVHKLVAKYQSANRSRIQIKLLMYNSTVWQTDSIQNDSQLLWKTDHSRQMQPSDNRISPFTAERSPVKGVWVSLIGFSNLTEHPICMPIIIVRRVNVHNAWNRQTCVRGVNLMWDLPDLGLIRLSPRFSNGPSFRLTKELV